MSSRLQSHLSKASTFRFLIISYIYCILLCRVFTAARGLSRVASSRGCSLLRCRGFSCCRAWPLGHAAFHSCGATTLQHVESSRTRDRTPGWIGTGGFQGEVGHSQDNRKMNRCLLISCLSLAQNNPHVSMTYLGEACSELQNY